MVHLTECYETARHLELEDAARVGFPPVASLEIGLAPLGREGPGELRYRRRVLTEAPHQGREVVAACGRVGHVEYARASGEVPTSSGETFHAAGFAGANVSHASLLCDLNRRERESREPFACPFS